VIAVTRRLLFIIHFGPVLPSSPLGETSGSTQLLAVDGAPPLTSADSLGFGSSNPFVAGMPFARWGGRSSVRSRHSPVRSTGCMGERITIC